MPDFPEEIQRTAKPVLGITKPGQPLYYSWVFDPVEGVAHISDDHKRERRHKKHHEELSEKVGHHPDRVHGYAYRIRFGWRVTDTDHHVVDGFVRKAVAKAIREKEAK